MNLFAVKTAARGLTFRRWATTLEISNAVERKPNHLSGGGPTGCHGRSAENPITVPKTDVAGTGQSQQTVASPRVIRYSLLRDFMDSTKRSEEHTSELQSRLHLVCRLLLEKKKIAHERRLGGAFVPQLLPVRLERELLVPLRPDSPLHEVEPAALLNADRRLAGSQRWRQST